MTQLSDRNSLRDIVNNIFSQAYRLYHFGSTKLSRSNRYRINKEKYCALYETLFGRLLSYCQGMTSSYNFFFNNLLYPLDASTIDLCLSIASWVDFCSTRGVTKLHVGLNDAGYLHEFSVITEGKTSNIEIDCTLDFSTGSIVAIDRGWNILCRSHQVQYTNTCCMSIFFLEKQRADPR